MKRSRKVKKFCSFLRSQAVHRRKALFPRREEKKWMRRILLIWAIRNKRWDIVILIMLIDEGQEKAVTLDEKMKEESGWQEFLLGRTF